MTASRLCGESNTLPCFLAHTHRTWCSANTWYGILHIGCLVHKRHLGSLAAVSLSKHAKRAVRITTKLHLSLFGLETR